MACHAFGLATGRGTIAAMAYEHDSLRWNGWGTTDSHFDLGEGRQSLWSFIAERLGSGPLPSTPAPSLESTTLPSVRLSDAGLGALKKLVGDDCIRTDARERARHAYGRSYADVIRLRSGQLSAAPDAVVYPRSSKAVADVLTLAVQEGWSVIPYGGGSSVVGGVEATRDRITLTIDTTFLSGLLELDETSGAATFGAGTWGPDLEDALAQKRLTLGHFPQSFEFSTLGGWIAARGAGQESNRYGPANRWLLGARVVTPVGEIRTHPFPQSAAGPRLNEVLCGSEGTLGIITEATVQVRPRAESSAIRTFLFRTFEAGAAAIRSVVQSGVPVAMMRLSDADETYFYGTLKNLRQPPSALTSLGERGLDAIGLGAGVGDGRCALLVGIDGTEGDVKRHHRRVTSLCAAEGGVPIGAGPGRSWRKSRFATPYLRSPMLDRGLGIDTLETATHWTNVVPLWKRVRSAIEDSLGPCAVLAHISHAYRSGCSLYFTFLFLRDARDPMAQWRRVKAAASEAIATGGGTISHHHGVGLDHAPWMKRETGTLGMQMLAGAKAAVDPQGILNPGKLGLE